MYYTRTSDTNPTLDQRVQLANKANADLFISVHNNSDATGNFTKVKGTQVMYSESDDAKLSSKKLAEICLKMSWIRRAVRTGAAKRRQYLYYPHKRGAGGTD